MKILLYGELWSGTHIDCISYVLREKNIEFKIFDFYKYINPKRYTIFIDKVLNKILYENNEKLINNKLFLEIEEYKPDVLFISKGVNIYPETLDKFKRKGIIIANWNPDDFFNKLNSSKYLLDSLNIYVYVFSARKHLFDEYKDKGIRNPHYVEWYYIPWLHSRTTSIIPIKNIITFIGTYSKRRESILKTIEKDIPIEIWGSGWNFSSLKKNKNINIKNQFLPQSDFPNIISSSLINLNILTLENRDHTNLKIFEITASNGLLLTESIDASISILGKNAFYFDANVPKSLNESIDNIFSNNNDNSKIKDAGYKNITTNNHSIFDRVEQIINILK